MAFTQFPHGTNISDGVRYGSATTPGFNGGAIGMGTSPYFVYDLIPEAAVNNNISLANTIPAAGPLTLNYGALTAPVINGKKYVQFDYPRNVAFTVLTAATTATVTMIVNGLDYCLNPMSESITIPSGLAANAAVVGNKAFAYIQSIYASGNPGATSQISVGTGNTFGLPYPVLSSSYVIPFWSAAQDAYYQGTATLVGGTVTIPTVLANTITSPVTNLTVTNPSVANETLTITAAVANTSFTVTSSDPTSTSTFYWRMAVNPPALESGGALPYGTVQLDGVSPAVGTAFVATPYINADVAAPNILLTYCAGEANPALTPIVITAYSTNPLGFHISGEGGSKVSWTLLNPSANNFGPYNDLVPGSLPGVTLVADQTVQHNAWQGLASTATAGDVRGTFTPNTAPNGVQRMTLWIYGNGCDGNYYDESSQTVTRLRGVTQYYDNRYLP